jgi:NADH dehydrogenase FAD-containing subunit
LTNPRRPNQPDRDEGQFTFLGWRFGLEPTLELELLGKDSGVEVTLVNRNNFFRFTQMLHAAVTDPELTTIVTLVRKLLSKLQFFGGKVELI